MTRILIILTFLTSIAWSKDLTDKQHAEATARQYIQAFQEENWETLVGLMHPQTLEELKKAIIANWDPKVLTDKESLEIAKAFKVKTLNEAIKLSPSEMYIRLLNQSSKIPAMKTVTQQKVTILKTNVTMQDADFVVDLDMQTTMGDKIFSSTTHFLIEKVKDKFKVVSVTKTKKPIIKMPSIKLEVQH